MKKQSVNKNLPFSPLSKNKIHRKGQPDDYISKSTNIDYIPYKVLTSSYKSSINNNYDSIIKEIRMTNNGAKIYSTHFSFFDTLGASIY